LCRLPRARRALDRQLSGARLPHGRSGPRAPFRFTGTGSSYLKRSTDVATRESGRTRWSRSARSTVPSGVYRPVSCRLRPGRSSGNARLLPCGPQPNRAPVLLGWLRLSLPSRRAAGIRHSRAACPQQTWTLDRWRDLATRLARTIDASDRWCSSGIYERAGCMSHHSALCRCTGASPGFFTDACRGVAPLRAGGRRV